MDIWDKLDDAQYRRRLSLGDPQILDEVSEFLIKFTGNRLASKHKGMYKDIREVFEDTIMVTVEAVFGAIDKGVKEGNPKTFKSRAAFLKFVNETTYHKAIDEVRKQGTQKKYFTQLDTGESEDDDQASWEEKIAGGKSQACRASQDASDSVYTSICRRLAFELLKKEYRDIITEVYIFDAQGNLIGDDSTFNFAAYAKRVGKSVKAVRETLRRARGQWWKILERHLVRN
jgi:DNA-directed RNA polymerase specialized sigma24 family protein